MSTALLIAAIAPAIFLIVKVYRADRLEKEPIGLLVLLVVLGIVSTFGAIVLEMVGEWLLDGFLYYNSLLYKLIYYFVVIAGSEELVKFVMLKLGSYKKQAFNCMFDGIVYAVSVSLGFALFENILYVMESGWSVALLRAVTAIPGHACFGVFMGVWYGCAKYMQVKVNKPMEKVYLWLSVLLPMVIHGLYDFVLSMNSSLVILVFVVFVSVLFLVTVSVVKNFALEDFYLEDSGEV